MELLFIVGTVFWTLVLVFGGISGYTNHSKVD
jgi:hypothetical protein